MLTVMKEEEEEKSSISVLTNKTAADQDGEIDC